MQFLNTWSQNFNYGRIIQAKTINSNVLDNSEPTEDTVKSLWVRRKCLSQHSKVSIFGQNIYSRRQNLVLRFSLLRKLLTERSMEESEERIWDTDERRVVDTHVTEQSDSKSNRRTISPIMLSGSFSSCLEQPPPPPPPWPTPTILQLITGAEPKFGS